MVQVNHGFHVFKDGNAWCAVGPHFVDLQKSVAGFGDSPEDAVEALRSSLRGASWWQDKVLPKLDEFTIHSADAHIGGREECERFRQCEEGTAECHCLDAAR